MNPERARGLLEAERTRITEALQAATRLADEAAEATTAELSKFDQHPADIGSEVFEREKDAAVAGAVANDLAEVEAAIVRLDAGTYGTCEVCGRPVPDERLEAMPATRWCVEDAARVQRG